MPSLAEFQAEFARALRDADLPPPSTVRRGAPAARSRRFDVYRNNMAVSLVDALKAAFPAIRKLVGEEYVAAVARAYVDQYPPRSPVLLSYGERFGEFLDAFPSAAGFPYLGDVARLEWSRLNALHAADADPTDIQTLGAVPESSLDDVTLALHPSCSLVSSRWPVVSLWSATLDPDCDGDVDMNTPERALVLRPALKVAVHKLSPGGCVFIDELARGSSLGAAARNAMTADDDFDLADQLQFVFRVNAITAVNPPEQQQGTP